MPASLLPPRDGEGQEDRHEEDHLTDSVHRSPPVQAAL